MNKRTVLTTLLLITAGAPAWAQSPPPVPSTPPPQPAPAAPPPAPAPVPYPAPPPPVPPPGYAPAPAPAPVYYYPPPAYAPPPPPPPAAPPVPAAPRFSLALERAAGFSAVTVDPDKSTQDLTGSVFVLGGPAANPLAAPRLALDFLLPGGFTLGGAIWFIAASAKADNDEEKASALFIEPRVGYRIALSPGFDLVPRFGLAFAQGSAQASSGRSTDEVEGSATVASGEVVGVWRLTGTFNVLAGLAFDKVVGASGNEKGKSSKDVEASVHSLQLWFGLGGYL